MEVRKVSVSDLNIFVEAYKKAYRGLENYAYRDEKSVKNYFKWLLKRDPEGFMVAEDSKSVLGFVACDVNWISIFEMHKVGEIHEIFVLPEFRNRGIGSKLLENALEYAKSRGRKVVELWVGKENYLAIKFYEKHGFVSKEELGKWLRMRRNV